MGEKVLACIITELKKSKDYSFSVDSTPDITHLDQLTFTVRYVTDQGPIERFLMFVPIEGHNAEHLTEVVVKFFKDNDIDINDCRGQSYDNASNMPGRYSRLWQKILSYLGTKKKVAKSLSATRWSARIDAIAGFYISYPDITRVLDDLSKDDTQSNETRIEAKSILKQMKKFENVLMTRGNMDLYIACSLLNSLELYLSDIREKFNAFLEKAKSFTDIYETESTSDPINRRRSVKLTRFEGQSEDTQLTGDDRLKIEVFYRVIDSLCSNLRTIKADYETMNDDFKFFIALPDMKYEEIKECCEKLAKHMIKPSLQQLNVGMFTL
ncbi:uncharacterized protein LOC128892986 [Hylaeus anthracinus]|uniref:uncharacterized protein LOC128892986 n=1 Tax=Hylaeus anthracinus TaxID=313031 RepID=UPI0023B9B21D|nr:uncharacterized protein LOC128892986 [Hylaeus anthracinus]